MLPHAFTQFREEVDDDERCGRHFDWTLTAGKGRVNVWGFEPDQPLRPTHPSPYLHCLAKASLRAFLGISETCKRGTRFFRQFHATLAWGQSQHNRRKRFCGIRGLSFVTLAVMGCSASTEAVAVPVIDKNAKTQTGA